MKRKSFISYLSLLLLGALAALPLLFGELSLLSFALWAPFAYYTKRNIEKPLKENYLNALLFFEGYFMAAFSFFVYMYPLDFAGLDTFGSVTVILAAVVLLPLFQSSVFALSGLFLALAGRRKLFRFPTAFALFFASLCLVSVNAASSLLYDVSRHLEDMGILIRGDTDLKGKIRIAHLTAGSLKEAYFFQSVRSVGKQFAQEDLVIGIQRMGKNIEQFTRFRTELMRGFRHNRTPYTTAGEEARPALRKC